MYRERETEAIPQEALRQSRGRQMMLTAYVLLLVAVAAAVFAVACAAVDRFGWKLDLTQDQVFRLTDTTRDILAELERPVDLIYCNAENDADSNIKEVLRRYAGASGQIEIQYLDLAANPAAVEEWAGRDIRLSEDGVLVACGQNARFLPWNSLYALNTFTDENGVQRYTLSGLQAETKLTSAIVSVTGQGETAVAFTAGHSEDAPQALLDLLESANYRTEQTVLGVEPLEEAVSTVVIAGAKRDFSEKELQILDAFMTGGGNLMVFRDPEVAELPNLDGYLRSWGVTVEDRIVLEPSQQLDSPLNIIPVFGLSTINVRFSEESTYLVLPECRALTLDNPNGCVTNAVLRSTSAAYGKDYASMTTLAQAPGDAAGPFTVAATSERSYTDGEGTAKTQYLFAAACTGFYQEPWLGTESLGNADLVLQVLALMNDTDVTLRIPVKRLAADDIAISRGGVIWFSAVFAAAVPLALLAAGAAVFVKRRRA